MSIQDTIRNVLTKFTAEETSAENAERGHDTTNRGEQSEPAETAKPEGTAESAENGDTIERRQSDQASEIPDQTRSPADGERTVQLQSLDNTFPLPVAGLSSDGDIVAWNQQMAQLTGISATEAMGNSVSAEQTSELAKRLLTAFEVVCTSQSISADDTGLTRVADFDNESHRGTVIVSLSADEAVSAAGSLPPVFRYAETLAVTAETRTQETPTPDSSPSELRAVVTPNLNARHGSTTGLETRPSDETTTPQNGSESDDQTADSETQSSVPAVVNELEDVERSLAQSRDTLSSEGATLVSDVDEQTELLATIVQDIQVLTGEMEQMASVATSVDTTVSTVATTAREGADAGISVQDDVKETVDAMESLTERAERVDEQMDSIEQVVDIIADIADQTNMLALNANIEAARAGSESGNTDGFAVVADEIKQLANDTQHHTDEISEDITALRSETDALLAAITSANEQLDESIDDLLTLVDQFETIAADLQDASDQVTEISSAASDQAEAVGEVTHSIENVQAVCETARMTSDLIVDEAEQQKAALDTLDEKIDSLRDVD